MEDLSTDQTETPSHHLLQSQFSVPNLPTGKLSRGSPTPVRTKQLFQERLHRRHNSFSGGIDAHVVPLNEGNSASLLEIATNLLKTAPVALCGGQYHNDDELILLPKEDIESSPRNEAVLVSEQALTRNSPHFRGHHCYYYDIHDSEEDMSIPEDEAYSSAPSTYRSSTSCDTSEYDQFSSSRSCIFTHSRNSSLASNQHMPVPSVVETMPVMTHGRKPSNTSVQSAPVPVSSHPLECAVTSTRPPRDVDVGSQVTLKEIDANLSGEGEASSGGETDGTKQATEQPKKSKKKSKVAKWEDSLVQRGIKSVEWIKKQCEEDRESMVQVKISSKSKHVVHFNVKAGDVVMWQFATKKRDIAFGVLFESTQVAKEEVPVQHQNEATDKMTNILPLLRVPSNSYVIEGSHTAPSDGFYVIGWDNAFSRFFAKELFYKITTKMSQSPIPEPPSEQPLCDLSTTRTGSPGGSVEESKVPSKDHPPHDTEGIPILPSSHFIHHGASQQQQQQVVDQQQQHHMQQQQQQAVDQQQQHYLQQQQQQQQDRQLNRDNPIIDL